MYTRAQQSSDTQLSRKKKMWKRLATLPSFGGEVEGGGMRLYVPERAVNWPLGDLYYIPIPQPNANVTMSL